MKRLFWIPVILVGCGSNPPPQAVYANPPVVQLVLEGKAQQMSRQEVINATHDCEEANLRATVITSKRMISGMMSDIIIDVQCVPKYRFY